MSRILGGVRVKDGFKIVGGVSLGGGVRVMCPLPAHALISSANQYTDRKNLRLHLKAHNVH